MDNTQFGSSSSVGLSADSHLWKTLAWWVLFLICGVYGIYAFYMGGLEILHQLALVADAPHRALPLVFILHALAGGAALIIGPLQLNQLLLVQQSRLHRLLGRLYIYMIWIASIAGLWSAIFFDVPIAARVVLGWLAVLWFGITTIGFHRATIRQFAEHREWMIRSFSLSFFFITFSFWVPLLTNTRLPEDVSYPLAVFLSWGLNILAAEIWIRTARSENLERER